MEEPKIGNYGIICFNGEYVAHTILGTKENGKFVLFPPLVVPATDVVKQFESEEAANLWISKSKIMKLESDLAREIISHEKTKQKFKAAMALIKAQHE